MSYVEVDPSTHDVFVSLGINMLQQEHGCRLVSADGGLPFTSHQAGHPPVLVGYRPDAILSNGAEYFLLESKNFRDVATPHSLIQYKAALAILGAMPEWRLFVLVFAAPSCSPAWPEEISGLIAHPRVMLRALEEGGAP
jgi:hypothetical protein